MGGKGGVGDWFDFHIDLSHPSTFTIPFQHPNPIPTDRITKADQTTHFHANRKDRLKKNPVVSNDELNQVSGGLGDEAAKEFGKGGLGKGIGKAFD